MSNRLLTAGLFAGALATQAFAQDDHRAEIYSAPGGMPMEGGQSAFAAIAEIVALLTADPETDWTRVDVEALRQHLIDMDNVTLRGEFDGRPSPGGTVFTVNSTDPAVAASIRRMVAAHAATMDGTGGLALTADLRPDGADLTVIGDEARVRAIGFIGVMTLGMHHQAHHMAVAQGGSPH